MNNTDNSQLRLALPSKGALGTPTFELFKAAGLKISRPNERQYVGSIPSIPAIQVLFQRAADIFTKVKEGSADLGITGYDIVYEEIEEHDDVIVIYEKLGFGSCHLVLAVPDSWVDVSSLEDLADLMVFFKEKGRELRIVTKYPNATKNWLYQRRIIHFSLVDAKGALEAAPSMGYADMIVDITSTGTTLRENQLKQITGGTILSSQACIIANKRLLKENPDKQQITRQILESIEAHRESKKYVSITANIQGESADIIGKYLLEQQNLIGLAGLKGPSIAKVYSEENGDWFAVTVVVKQEMLFPTVNHLRKAGGTDITVFSPSYIFEDTSVSWQQLQAQLNLLNK